MLADYNSKLTMSASAEAENVEETVHLSVNESAVDVAGHAVHTGHVVADPYADANRKRNLVRLRVFKTICIYISFGTLVCYLKHIML